MMLGRDGRGAVLLSPQSSVGGGGGRGEFVKVRSTMGWRREPWLCIIKETTPPCPLPII